MYNIRKFFKFIFLCSVLIYTTGCEYNVFEPVDIGDALISFQGDLLPIFQASCLEACHDNTTNRAPVLETDKAYSALIAGGFINPGNGEISLLYRRLIGDPEIRNGRTMPIAEKLPDYQIQMIKKWIDQGAQNN